MTDLHKIANTPGFGSGKRARDQLAAEAEALALLPNPRALPCFVAGGDALMLSHALMCGFGRSSEEGADWAIYHDGVTEADAIGHDTKLDAQIVAAILNAYRMGLLVRSGK